MEHDAVTDADFEVALEQGLEPCNHLSNLRVAWLMLTRHGAEAGLQETHRAIRRRAERMGSPWDPELTRRWFERVAETNPCAGDVFDQFVADHPELLAGRRERAHAVG